MCNANIIEIFENFLDQIFYTGYAEWAKENNPEAYNFELTNFNQSYNF